MLLWLALVLAFAFGLGALRRAVPARDVGGRLFIDAGLCGAFLWGGRWDLDRGDWPVTPWLVLAAAITGWWYVHHTGRSPVGEELPPWSLFQWSPWSRPFRRWLALRISPPGPSPAAKPAAGDHAAAPGSGRGAGRAVRRQSRADVPTLPEPGNLEDEDRWLRQLYGLPPAPPARHVTSPLPEGPETRPGSL